MFKTKGTERLRYLYTHVYSLFAPILLPSSPARANIMHGKKKKKKRKERSNQVAANDTQSRRGAGVEDKSLDKAGACEWKGWATGSRCTRGRCAIHRLFFFLLFPPRRDAREG